MGFMTSARAKQRRTNAQRYEVDAAMMGRDWGDAQNLSRFCDVLQAVVGESVSITRITDSHNGAQNANPDLVSEDQWIEALRRYERSS